MSTRQIRKRVEKVEEKVCPEHDGSYTLEELCRMLWRQDKRGYLEMANGGDHTLRLFVQQFEREDAERRYDSCTRQPGIADKQEV
jgi:hypothetical protein